VVWRQPIFPFGEGDGADVRRIFSGQAAASPTRVLSGTLVHVLAVAALLLVVRLVPDRVYSTILPERMPAALVYLVDPGPGGGGGGGDKSPEPPPPAELKGPDQTTVQRDGWVTDVRVIRSLDQSFGLDMKAIEAARKWEFYPGTRFGEPVPVLVNIELTFNLR
jgi:TonB family protein